MFHVLILNARPKVPEEIIFEGQSNSVTLPGIEGEFEILDFHKPIISQLKKGLIVVDNTKEYKIKAGIAKMDHQSLVAVVEL